MRKAVPAAIFVIGSVALPSVGGLGAALALENRDAFCASCHTEPELTYYQRSVQRNATDLASFHAQEETRCIDCHSGGGLFGRTQGLEQGAHDLAAYWLGTYHRPAITTNPLGDASCTKCHNDVLARQRTGRSRAMNGHYHFFLARWQAIDPNAARCTSCHTAHSAGLASLRFMAQGKVGQLCEGCHDALGGREE